MERKPILIIGGGISGITTTVEAAEVGYKVILIEKLPYLGGRVAKMNQYFPKLCPPYCGLEINFKRIKQNPRIQVFTSTTIESVSGSKGDFLVKLKTAPAFVNGNCTVCGECEKVCPAERSNEFNYGMDNTKAVYLPHEMAFPLKYDIDNDSCLKKECQKCVEVCEYDAINFDINTEYREINVSSIVLATGWEPYDAAKIDNLNYSLSDNIITNVQMERLAAPNGPTEGKILRPSDNIEPKTIAFVQCAGSRDENHLPYCSAVCCSASLKQALNLRQQIPACKVKIFYIDLRVTGRNEDFLNKVRADENIELIKGKVAKINNTASNRLLIEAEDIMSGKKNKEEVDLVVLATGIVPTSPNIDIIRKDESGFIIADELAEGIYTTACTKRPQDVSSSMKDATGIALKAIQAAQ